MFCPVDLLRQLSSFSQSELELASGGIPSNSSKRSQAFREHSCDDIGRTEAIQVLWTLQVESPFSEREREREIYANISQRTFAFCKTMMEGLGHTYILTGNLDRPTE